MGGKRSTWREPTQNMKAPHTSQLMGLNLCILFRVTESVGAHPSMHCVITSSQRCRVFFHWSSGRKRCTCVSAFIAIVSHHTLVCYCAVTPRWQMRLEYSEQLLTVVSLEEEVIQWVLWFCCSQAGSRLRWWLPMTPLTHFCLHRTLTQTPCVK